MLRPRHAGQISGQKPLACSVDRTPIDAWVQFPDPLTQALVEVRSRTSAKVSILPPKQGDFALYAPPGQTIDFKSGQGLLLKEQDGRYFVSMQPWWYDHAAARYHEICIERRENWDPDAHLLARLIDAPATKSIVDQDDHALLRIVMEAPYLLRTASKPRKDAFVASCIAQMRNTYARKLATSQSLYALRGCACAIALLWDQPIPVLSPWIG